MNAKLRTWLQATRMYAAPASALPVLLGTASALPVRKWDLPILAAELVAILLIHTGGNLLNDCFDKIRGVDGPPEEEPPEYAYRKALSAREIARGGLACLALALLPGAYLVWRGGHVALALGLMGLAAAWLYTGPPLNLKYHALGDVLIFLSFGVLPTAGAAYMQVHAFPVEAFLVAVPAGLLIVAILHGNNYRDAESDASAGIRTFAMLIGPGLARTYYRFLVCTPGLLVAAFVVAGALPPPCLATLAALPPAMHLGRLIEDRDALKDIDVRTARFMALFSALLLAGLILSTL